MQSVNTYEALVGLIKSESERLKEYVSALSPEALERPSPCERWNVGEVIAHLIWFAEIYGGMMERGLRGDLSPTEGFPAVPGTLSGPDIDELYSQAAIARRRSLGQKLLPAFCERYDRLDDMLKGIGPDDWDKPCYHTARIRPVESFLPTIVAEMAVHEGDIRSTLEPSPAISKNAVPVLMEKIPGNRRPWSVPFETADSSSQPIRFRLEFNGKSGSRDIVVEGDKTRIESSRDGAANLILSGDSGVFVLLLYGRLTIDSAMAAGYFTAQGDLGLIPDFDRWLDGH